MISVVTISSVVASVGIVVVVAEVSVVEEVVITDVVVSVVVVELSTSDFTNVLLIYSRIRSDISIISDLEVNSASIELRSIVSSVEFTFADATDISDIFAIDTAIRHAKSLMLAFVNNFILN